MGGKKQHRRNHLIERRDIWRRVRFARKMDVDKTGQNGEKTARKSDWIPHPRG
jgi:hypothetical protein